MARVIAEQVFAEPLSDDRLRAMSQRLDPCLEVRDGTWRRSSISHDKLRMTCEFEAPDAEAVRQAFRTSGIEFVRVWTADVFAVEDYPEQMAKLEALLARKASKVL